VLPSLLVTTMMVGVNKSEQEKEFDDNLIVISPSIPKIKSNSVNISEEEKLDTNEEPKGAARASLGDVCHESVKSSSQKTKKKKKKHRKRHRRDYDDMDGDGDVGEVEWIEEAVKDLKKKKKKKRNHGFVDVEDDRDADAWLQILGERMIGGQRDDGPCGQNLSPKATSLPSDSNISPQRKADSPTKDHDSANNYPNGDLEIGPKFHMNQRVLCIDIQQQMQQQHSLNQNQRKEVSEVEKKINIAANCTVKNEDASDDKPPLYEATVRKSALRYVDAITQKILPEIKYSSSKKGGRQRSHHQHHQQQNIEHGVKQWCHLIHFKGWNSRWDRWMIESEIFPDIPEYRTRVNPQVGKITKVAGPSGLSTEATPKEKGKKKRKGKVERTRGDNHGIVNKKGAHEEDETPIICNHNKIVRACELPFTLKTIMIDDQDKITKIVYPPPSFTSGNVHLTRDDIASENTSDRKRGISMLHVLPSAMSIQSIMAQFVHAMKRRDLEEFEKLKNEYDEWNARQAGGKIPSTKNEFDEEIDDPLKMKDCRSNKSDDSKATEGNKSKLHPKDEISDPKTEKNTPPIPSKESFKLKKKKRKEFAVSILELLDASLPLFLLYKEERSQFIKLMSETNREKKKVGELIDSAKIEDFRTKRPCQIYGAEFLLRLIVRMPFIVAQFDSRVASTLVIRNNAPAKSLSKTPGYERDRIRHDANRSSLTAILESDEFTADLEEFLMELIVYLQRNCESCFKRKYIAAEKIG